MVDESDVWRARRWNPPPIATIDQWHSPVLLVQADNDSAVPSQQVLRSATKQPERALSVSRPIKYQFVTGEVPSAKQSVASSARRISRKLQIVPFNYREQL